jgi:hypothetical protein
MEKEFNRRCTQMRADKVCAVGASVLVINGSVSVQIGSQSQSLVVTPHGATSIVANSRCTMGFYGQPLLYLSLLGNATKHNIDLDQ